MRVGSSGTCFQTEARFDCSRAASLGSSQRLGSFPRSQPQEQWKWLTGRSHQNQIACSVPAPSRLSGPLKCESSASRVVHGGAQWAPHLPALPSRGPGCSSRPAWSLCSLTALCRNLTLVETVMHDSTWKLQPSESTPSAAASSTPHPLLPRFLLGALQFA